MLARLDQELAPARAAVNREGDLLRIAGVRGAPVGSTVIAVVSTMGYLAEPAEAEPEHVSRWYTREEVAELSVEEARVLTTRLVAELEQEGILVRIDKAAATSFIEETLVSGFQKAAETGEIDIGSFEPPTIHRGFTPDQREELVRWLRRKAEGGPARG